MLGSVCKCIILTSALIEGMSDMKLFDIKKMTTCIILVLALLFGLSGCGSRGSLDQDPELSMKFGLDMAKRGLWKEALLRWENALKLSPNDPRIHNNLAIAYENEGDYEKAEVHYKKAMELDPLNDSIRINYNNFVGFLKKIDSKKAELPGGTNDAQKK